MTRADAAALSALSPLCLGCCRCWLLILGLVAYPFLFAIWVSFTDRVIGGGGEFIGLDNFRYLADSATFGAAIRNTVLIVLVTDALKLRSGSAWRCWSPSTSRRAASSARS